MRVFQLAVGCMVATFCIGTATADTFGILSPFDIEFVTVGNSGNPDDNTGNPDPAGKVDYNYRISTYEISESMIDKANDEGGLALTWDTRGPNKPVTGLSWFEAARFINWLNASNGHQVAYNFDSQGIFQLWSSAEAWQQGGENLFRHKDAVYFLPSTDEWYKAAYYDPTSGVYYDYTTGSNAPPNAVASGTTAGSAVYLQSGPADITQAGGLSPYGTMGQGGNVYEWEETDIDLVNDSGSSLRGYRGGYWGNNVSFLSSSSVRPGYAPSSGDNILLGFRVASTVPEPSSLLLGAIGSCGLLMRRRRQR